MREATRICIFFWRRHIWFSKTSCSPTILATETVTICPTADADIDSSASGINSANTCQQTHASQSQARPTLFASCSSHHENHGTGRGAGAEWQEVPEGFDEEVGRHGEDRLG